MIWLDVRTNLAPGSEKVLERRQAYVRRRIGSRRHGRSGINVRIEEFGS
jgi:hypothetical protein